MRNKILFSVLCIVAIVVLGAAAAAWYKSSSPSEMEGDLAVHDISATTAPAAGEESVMTPVPTTTEAPAAATPNVKASDIHIVADGSDPKGPRSIGKLDAPVTMIEFSSLTCPHCAHAHESVLPQLIKDYVETGKLRIVFNDFPLNQQAMDASKVSRCMPADQYFNFLTLLFGSIDQWAFSNHPNALIQNAVLAGLPEARARECLADKDVETALVEDVQVAIKKYNINSTPTFVLNDGKKVIMGARPYAEFKAAIDELLAAQ